MCKRCPSCCQSFKIRFAKHIVCVFSFKTPGKPRALKILSDMVAMFWTKSEDQVDYYQIRYKSKAGKKNWKFAETSDQNQKNHYWIEGRYRLCISS